MERARRIASAFAWKTAFRARRRSSLTVVAELHQTGKITPHQPHDREVSRMQPMQSDESRLVAALGYPLWPVALIVLFTDMKQNRFVRTHAIQALGYAVAWVVVYLAMLVIPGGYFLVWLLSLAWFVLALLYAYRAYQGEVFSIPIVGQFTERYIA